MAWWPLCSRPTPSVEASEEARAASAAYRLVEPRIGPALAACPSGRELTGWGYASDVTIAAELDQSRAVPTLRDGWLEAQVAE